MKMEVQDLKPSFNDAFKDIKPQENITLKEVNAFWDKKRLERDVSAYTYPLGIPNEIIKNGIGRRFDEGIANKRKPNEIRQEILNEYTNKCEDFKRKILSPENDGVWTGERGNSNWVPDDNYIPKNFNPDNKTWRELKKELGFKEISFNNNYPDFSKISKGKTEIDDFGPSRPDNFTQATEKYAEQTGRSPEEVDKWMKENGYSWEECSDCKTLMQVPRVVHGNIRHTGGHSIISNFG